MFHRLQGYYHFQLSESFIWAVGNLSDSADAVNLIAEFGTHFTYEVGFGAKIMYSNSFISANFSALQKVTHLALLQ